MVPITIDPYMVSIVIHCVITINPYFERYTYVQNERVCLKFYSQHTEWYSHYYYYSMAQAEQKKTNMSNRRETYAVVDTV